MTGERYRRRATPDVEVMTFTGDNHAEVAEFMSATARKDAPGSLQIHIPDGGYMHLVTGWLAVREVESHRPVANWDPEMFAARYQEVSS